MLRKTAPLLSLFALLGCGGGDPAPKAFILEASPDEIDPARDDADDVSILLEYRDPDGDLGEGVAEVYDCRVEGLTSDLDIPPIANMKAVDKGVSIRGELELVLSDVGDLAADDAAPPTCAELGAGDPVEGEVVFCVVLVDAAGNVGEGDCTSPIRVAAAGD